MSGISDRSVSQRVRRASAASAILGLAVHVHACASIEPIPLDVCGNHVVEAGEDCDGFPASGMACRPSGEEGQCRFDCSGSSDGCVAPYGCGADGICRAPLGAIELANETDEDASLLTARDFDADGSHDLLIESSGGNVLTYGRDGFEADLDVDLVGLGSDEQGAVGELTGDDLVDIVVAGPTGVGVMRGSAGRELLGTAYASFPIPPTQGVVVGAMDARTQEPGDEPIALIQLPDAFLGGPTLVLQVDPESITDDLFLISDPMTMPELVVDGVRSVDDLPTGQLDPSTPCDEYVLAFRAQDQVLVATACDRANNRNGDVFDPPDPPNIPSFPPPPPIAPIAVDLSFCSGPAPYPVDRVFVVRVDGDDQDDLLVVPEVPTGPAVAACVVLGPLTFFDPATMLPAAAAIAQPFPAITVQTGERVLRVQDLDDDGALDLVSSEGIFLTGATCLGAVTRTVGGPFCDVTPGMLGPLTSVAIGDFNADTVLDLVVADGLTDSARAQIGHLDGTFSSFPVFTDGLPRHLAAGDFDGDGVDDLVSAARSCEETSCTAPDVLEVVFGRVAEGPEEPRRIGRLGRIEQFQVAKFDSTSGFDGTADLGVVFTDLEDPTKASYATLFGSTQRQLEAPFVITEAGAPPDEAKLYRPLAVAPGHFAERGAGGDYEPSGEEPDRSDIAAVTYSLGETDPSDDVRLWLLAVEREAELSEARSWPSKPLDRWEGFSPFISCALAGNLDADPAHELVYVGGKGFVVADVQSINAAPPAFVPTYYPTEDLFVATRWLEEYPQEVQDFVVNTAVPAILADLDGSGALDLVSLAYVGEKQVLVVYWNSDGQFSTSSAGRSVVELSSPAHALVAIHLDADAQLEIVVADDAGGSVVQVSATPERALSAPVALFGAEDGVAPAVGVAAADFDGDGVTDVAFGHEGQTTLYRSLPGIE